MALIIEDGTQVAGSNSYITIAEYTTWADARFSSSRSTAPTDDEDIEALILRATDWFETNKFIGRKVNSTQSMQWPRVDAYIDGYSVGSAVIPDEVKAAIYELSYAEESGNGQLATVERETKREKVGELEVEYSDTASSRDLNVAVSRAIKKLLGCGSMNRVVRI